MKHDTLKAAYTQIQLLTKHLPFVVPLHLIMAHRRKRSPEWGQTPSRMAPVISDTVSCTLKTNRSGDTTMIKKDWIQICGFCSYEEAEGGRRGKMHCCHAVYRRLSGSLCYTEVVLSLVQHISVLGGSSKCSQLSIFRFQRAAVQDRLNENHSILRQLCIHSLPQI